MHASAEQAADAIEIILKFTKLFEGMAVSSLKVSIATGASGPVLVLAGEADFTSITWLDEALTAQISGPAVQRTIAANLRYADPASMTTLVMAAMKVRTRAGSVTLLDPQPPVARMLDLLCIDEMFSIRRRAAGETHPDSG
jgi:anti-anti-sigma factor